MRSNNIVNKSMAVESIISKYADSIALVISVYLFFRVEQLHRKISRLCGKLDIVATVIGGKNDKKD